MSEIKQVIAVGVQLLTSETESIRVVLLLLLFGFFFAGSQFHSDLKIIVRLCCFDYIPEVMTGQSCLQLPQKT